MNPFYDARKSHTVIAVFKGYIIMPNGDRPKVDQHTVPQVYLRGFSDDKKHIRYYDFKSRGYSNGRVKIKDICFKKYMYEFYDNDGNIDSINIIENHLEKYERKFGKYCDKLKAMMNPKSFSYYTRLVMDEEVAFWTVYTVIQYLRSNHTISSLQKLLWEDNPSESQQYTRNKVLYNCLPIFMHKCDRGTLAFDRVVEWFLEMDFVVLISFDYEFITSDNPVCGIADDQFKVCRFVFPITRNIAIQFIDKADVTYKGTRTVAVTTREYVEAVNIRMGQKAEKQIYFERIDEAILERIISERAGIYEDENI